MTRSLLAGLLLALLSATAAAQAYPARPLRLIVPFPPGGSNDIVARMVATQLGERLAKPVVVENHGGAGGIIGTEIAAKSAPDGYTLLLISVAFAFNSSIYKLSYDPASAFTPVAMLGSGPVVLAVSASLPVSSVKELLALAREKPGELHYASAGVGSFQHLAAALFKLQSGVDIVHVPFRGGGPALMDVVAGNTQIAIGALVQMLPQIRTGRLKALGIGSAKRVAALPEVPTIAEAGVPGYEATNWWGVVAPAGVPAGALERLHRELEAVLGTMETRHRFETEGAEATRMSADDFGKLIASETQKWARVVKDAGIKAE